MEDNTKSFVDKSELEQTAPVNEQVAVMVRQFEANRIVDEISRRESEDWGS